MTPRYANASAGAGRHVAFSQMASIRAPIESTAPEAGHVRESHAHYIYSQTGRFFVAVPTLFSLDQHLLQPVSRLRSDFLQDDTICDCLGELLSQGMA